MIWFFNRFKSVIVSCRTCALVPLLVFGKVESFGMGISSDALPDFPVPASVAVGQAPMVQSTPVVAQQPPIKQQATPQVVGPSQAQTPIAQVQNTTTTQSQTLPASAVVQTAKASASTTQEVANTTSTTQMPSKNTTSITSAGASGAQGSTSSAITPGKAVVMSSGVTQKETPVIDPSKNGWYREYPESPDKGDLVFYLNGEETGRAGWNWENPNDKPGPSGDFVLRHPGFGKPGDKNFIAPGTIIDRKGWYRLKEDKDGLFIGRAWENGMSPMAVAQAQFTSTILFPIVFGGLLVALGAYAAVRMSPGKMKDRLADANIETTNILQGQEFGSVGHILKGSDKNFKSRLFSFLRSRNLSSAVPKKSDQEDLESAHINRIAALLLGIQTRIAKATGPLGEGSPVSEAIVRRQYLTGQLPDELKELADLLHKNKGENGFTGALLESMGLLRDGQSEDPASVEEAINKISGLGRRMSGETAFGFEDAITALPPYNKGAFKADFKPVEAAASAAYVSDFMVKEETRQRRANSGVTDQAVESAEALYNKHKEVVLEIASNSDSTLRAIKARLIAENSSDDPKVVEDLKKYLQVCTNLQALSVQMQGIKGGSVQEILARAKILEAMRKQLEGLPFESPSGLEGQSSVIESLRNLKSNLESKDSEELLGSVNDDLEQLKNKRGSKSSEELALETYVSGELVNATRKILDPQKINAALSEERAAIKKQREAEEQNLRQQSIDRQRSVLGQLGGALQPQSELVMHLMAQNKASMYGYDPLAALRRLPAAPDPVAPQPTPSLRVAAASEEADLAEIQARIAQANAAKAKAEAEVSSASAPLQQGKKTKSSAAPTPKRAASLSQIDVSVDDGEESVARTPRASLPRTSSVSQEQQLSRAQRAVRFDDAQPSPRAARRVSQ